MISTKKIILSILLAALLFSSFNVNISYATSLSEMEEQASEFIKKGKDNAGDLSEVTTAATSNFVELGKILTLVGAGVLVAVIAYMGIKYLTSPPDKQGALKQQLIGVVVAGIVIFGAYGIWKAMVNVFSNFD